MKLQVPGGDAVAVAPTVFLKLPLTRQSTCFSCGCAALQSLLGWYGHDYNEGTLMEELGAGPDHGTRYPRMLQFAKELGIETVERERMTLDSLRACLMRGNPVLLALQAWASDPIDVAVDYTALWEDGHYVVAVGFDDARVFFMDPSTLGAYTYLPNDVFATRWHDYYNPVDGDAQRIDLHQWGYEFVAARRFAPDTIQYLG